MQKNTVKRKIFLSNTLMVLITLFIFLIINIIFMIVYFHLIKEDVAMSIQQAASIYQIEDIIEHWTIHNYTFLSLFTIDGLICIFVLILISQFFTKNLSIAIMHPLNILSKATERIKRNDLSTDIDYKGYMEFEEICTTFNEMQHHLLNAQEINQKYEKARADMIAGISHDLRTPLTAIKGSIKAILDKVCHSNEQQQKMLEIAYHRTGDMDRLLNHLFYLSHLETGNIKPQLNPTNISEYLDDYVRYMNSIFDISKVKINLYDNINNIEVLIDNELLRRIFDNLVENSQKYANICPLLINITIDKKENWIDICFGDNGIGVPQEKLAYIFDEFYRADESRNNQSGNGLGLYIVKCLTESMNGKIKAENANGLHIHLLFPIYLKE